MLSKERAKITLPEKKIAVGGLKRNHVNTECLSKKQKLVLDIMFKKYQKSPKGMRYTNKFLLESLLLIKSIWYNFHDKTQTIYRNKDINYHFYKLVYEIDTSPEFAGLRACPKLTSAHLDPSSFQRMNVRLAFQLFSNTVSNGIQFFRWMKPDKFKGSEKAETFTISPMHLTPVFRLKHSIETLHPTILNYHYFRNQLILFKQNNGITQSL